MEEVISRNYLVNERPDTIINIIDGTNLERNLYLTTQIAELGIPMIVAVNMIDIVQKKGNKIHLSQMRLQIRQMVRHDLDGKNHRQTYQKSTKSPRFQLWIIKNFFPDMLCHLSMANSKFNKKKEKVLEIKIFGTRPL